MLTLPRLQPVQDESLAILAPQYECGDAATELTSFLTQLGGNMVTTTAYETAWVAALAPPDGSATPRFPETLAWLRAHQHADGSWGSPWPHYHDRLLSTLRAVLTLHQWNDPADTARIERGVRYIWREAGSLAEDPWETIGFELIFPALLAEAQQRGLLLPYGSFTHVQKLRQAKLALVPLNLACRPDSPLAVSIEGLGAAIEPERAARAQERDGGIGLSPSATAYLLRHCPDNRAAQTYLERALTAGEAAGGVPAFFPLETFEQGWVLYQLQHMQPDLYTRRPAATQPVLDFLHATRAAGGWSASVNHTAKEADTTGICFAVLGHAGYELDPWIIYQYEEANHFRCYPFERNPSVSANAHILDALHYCDPQTARSRIDKIVRFLSGVRQPGGYWFDKWHVSPCYPTSHIVQAAYDLAPALAAPAIDWLIHTQWEDGGWGYYASTLEETAYAVQALRLWEAEVQPLPDGVLARGRDYLRARFDPARMDYPPLWIHKVLYTPMQVVHGAILAALADDSTGW